MEKNQAKGSTGKPAQPSTKQPAAGKSAETKRKDDDLGGAEGPLSAGANEDTYD